MPKDTQHKAALAATIGQFSAAGAKPENQDFHGAAVPDGAALVLKGIAVAIADGISPSPVSREAAETAVAALMTDYYDTPDAWTAETSARRVIAAANAWLCGQNRGIEDLDRGHVCTLSALILKGREAHVLHLGDARIARVAGLSLEPLTEDHRAGQGGHLDRTLGLHEDMQPDYRRVSVAPGDIFVLTTDGVHEHLAPGTIARIASSAEPDAAARALVEAALDRGSPDNLTAQVVRVDRLISSAAPGVDQARLIGWRCLSPSQTASAPCSRQSAKSPDAAWDGLAPTPASPCSTMAKELAKPTTAARRPAVSGWTREDGWAVSVMATRNDCLTDAALVA